MSDPPHAPKRRQYAAGETQVYYGSASGQQPADVQPLYPQTYPDTLTLPDLQDVDLMTYPPDPRDLHLPPPEIRLPPGAFFPGSSTPRSDSRYQSATLNAVPKTEPLLHSVKLPLGLVISPYPTLPDGEEPVPTVDDGVIARCKLCRAYINPYVQFIDGVNWRCSLCAATSNPVPQSFDWSIIVNQPRDRYARTELTHSVVDFVATPEYLRNMPQAPAYAFLIDVSEGAISSGMFATAIRAISEHLDSLPNDQLRTKVAIICFDTALHFFSLRPGVAEFELLVVSDLERAYVPRPHSLLVNLSQARQSLEALLSQLPAIFKDARTSDSAAGPALDGALAPISPTGGKIILISASVPTVGKGALDLSKQTLKKDLDIDKSASEFYHAVALSCVKACVSVDMFLFGDRYRGIATLSLLPQYTSGQMLYYAGFSAAVHEDALKFAVELGRVLAMPIMLEAEMRVRCSRGIHVKSMHGNFFLQSSDSVVLPAVPKDQSYAFEFQIEETLTEPIAVFQSALLHTTSSGERRIRVLTLALPTTSVIAEVFASADARTIAALVAKQIVQRPSSLTLEDKRDKLFKLVADVCAAYARGTSGELQLLLPANLKMLPVLLLGLFKKLAIQLSSELIFDIRAYTRVVLSSDTISQLIRYIYPNVYCLHNMPTEVGFIGEERKLIMPAPLPLTSAWWEPHGLYLIDDGQIIYLWVGRDAVPQLIVDVFGVDDYRALRTGKIALPEVDTAISQRIRAIIGKIHEREGVVHHPTVCVVKDDSTSGDPALRAAAVQTLIHDRADDLRVSYKQFLLKIYGK
ncbi:CPII coat sec24 protein [Mycena maculata]|uniref:CPII coat sec24 protein n=1 Tax=Mycena maculata TaxID=230809 RepID=A0AAD7HV10_9AGAR|nr:CPII coat sec24 protein [Mycena maculata]